MMNRVGRLKGDTLNATDGEIGHIKEVYFDDHAWAIRYLVVDTGVWLSGREVLISPYSVKQPLDDVKSVDVTLTRKQVEDSPNIDTHLPVSRRHEREYLDYYAYPVYWAGDSLWAMNALPLVPSPTLGVAESAEERDRIERDLPPEDVHLRSSANVTGYDIQASDDSIGHVQDFIFDDESWAIRYLVVDTRNWWPGGKKVLIGTQWIDRIDWADRTVFVKLTRDQVKNSPVYVEGDQINRAYEQQLHEAVDRRGYWD